MNLFPCHNVFLPSSINFLFFFYQLNRGFIFAVAFGKVPEWAGLDPKYKPAACVGTIFTGSELEPGGSASIYSIYRERNREAIELNIRSLLAVNYKI